jgi:hypothetical protein
MVDSDGDGAPDADELADMTNPFDGNDRFRIISLVPVPDFDITTNRKVVVTVRTFPGFRYQFESDPAINDFK